MLTKTFDIANEVKALRSALADLARQLETFEEWRALCQLDERERAGNPLQSIDGVVVRGRLAQQLAEKSRVWRAYVRIEDAIGELIGPDIAEPAMISLAKSQDASNVALNDLLEEPNLVSVPLASLPDLDSETPTIAPNVAETEIVAPIAKSFPIVAETESIAVAIPTMPRGASFPTTPVDPGLNSAEGIGSHQRLRVKVRAASVAIPMIVAAASVPRDIKKIEVAAAESEVPEGKVEFSAAADPVSASVQRTVQTKDVLERIRPVRDIGGKPPNGETPPATVSETAMWGDRATDAPEPEIEIIQRALGGGGDGVARRADADIQEPVNTRVSPPAELLSAMPLQAEITFPDVAIASNSEVANIVPKRIAAVEAAISQLADPEIVSWTTPLDVIESRAAAVANAEEVPGRSRRTGLEMEHVEHSVDEAMVEIITGASTEAPAVSHAKAEKSDRRQHGIDRNDLSKAESTSSLADGDGADLVNPTGYGAFHLDVEEASVEIIVPAGGGLRSPG